MGTADGTTAPVRRVGFETRDLEVAATVIGQMYADASFDLKQPDSDFGFRVQSATAGPLTTGLLRYGFDGDAYGEPVDTFTTVLAHDGAMTLTTAVAGQRTLGAGGVWRYDTVEPLHAGLGLNGTYGTLQLPLSVLADVAAETTEVRAAARGDQAAAQVRFLDNVAVDDAAQRYWAGLMRFAHQQAYAEDSPLNSPLVRAQLVHTLAAAALVTFPNTTMTIEYASGPGDVGPATLRRAVAHAHAHAAEPDTVADLATAAGVGIRAVQHAFITHLGCPPTTYLRRIRLDRAHRNLQAADPSTGDTVTAIAARWGFANLGRFAAAYRARFDTAPADTLRAREPRPGTR